MKRFRNHLPVVVRPQALLGAVLLASLAACAGRSGGGASSTPPPPDNTVSTPSTPSATPTGDAAQRFQQSVQLMRDHKTDEAQAALEALVKDFPNYSGPQTNLGILYARAKQRDKAFTAFNRAIAANPKNATAHEWQGILYRESGDYANAERAYQQAIAAQPDFADAHYNLAILYDVYLKRPQDAVAQYREYQRVAGNNKPIVTAWINELQPPAAPAPATTTAPAAASSGSPAP